VATTKRIFSICGEREKMVAHTDVYFASCIKRAGFVKFWLSARPVFISTILKNTVY